MGRSQKSRSARRNSWLRTRTGGRRQARPSGPCPWDWSQSSRACPTPSALNLGPCLEVAGAGCRETDVSWTPLPLMHPFQPSRKQLLRAWGQRHTPHRTAGMRARGEGIGRQFTESLVAPPSLLFLPLFLFFLFLFVSLSAPTLSVSFIFASFYLCVILSFVAGFSSVI